MNITYRELLRISSAFMLWIVPQVSTAQPCLTNLKVLLFDPFNPFEFRVDALAAISGDGNTLIGESPDAQNFFFIWSDLGGYVDFPTHFVTITPSHNGKYMLGWNTGTYMVWNVSTGDVDVVTKPAGSTYGVPLTVTTSGAVLGTAYYGGSPYNERHVFRWTTAGGANALGDESINLHDASASGSVLVGASVGVSRENLMRWTSTSGAWETLERPDDEWYGQTSVISANGDYVAALVNYDSDGDSTLDTYAVGRWSLAGSYSQYPVTISTVLLMVDDEGALYFAEGDVEHWMKWEPGAGVKTAMEVLAENGISDSIWALATRVGNYASSSDGKTLITYGVGSALSLEGGCENAIRFDLSGYGGSLGPGSVVPLSILFSGPLSSVDLYFSADGVAWSLVAAALPAPFGTAQHDWIVPNVNTDYAWLRAEAAAGTATLGPLTIQGPPGSCGQVTHQWINATGGDYNVAGNWNTASVPDTLSSVMFEPDAPVSVAFDDSYVHSTLRIRQNAVSFDLNAHELVLLDPEGCVPAVHVQEGGALALTDGWLRSLGNVVLDGALATGLSIGASAQCAIDSGDGLGELRAGSGGAQGATVRLEAGGRFQNPYRSSFGYAFASSGHLQVDGNGSMFDSRSVILGVGGTGTASITGLGTVDADTVIVGASDSGRVVVATGGSLLSNYIVVGDGAPGHLDVSPDGTAETDVLVVGAQGSVSGSVLTLGTAPSPVRVRPAAAAGLTVDTLLLRSGGVLSVNSVELQPGGVLGGDGLFALDLVNSGTLSPGSEGSLAGVFRAGGHYTQTSTGLLRLDVGGPAAGVDHDVLAVTGTASLGGTLEVHLVNSFQPQPGEELIVLTAALVTGSFVDVTAPPGWSAHVTYDAGAVRVSLDVASDVNRGAEAGVQPEQYYLDQNYPNPFNPATSVRFGLPEPAFVDGRVFNLLGQEVAILVQESLEAGHHEVVFEPKALPSGLYFYRLQTGAFTATQKLLLLR